MKIIIIDTSHNASSSKINTFLKVHSDADRIYTFDASLWEYPSVHDLEADLEECQEEFFSKPCAYYDMMTAILGKVRKLSADSIIVYSPEIDECSRLCDVFSFGNYINHFNIYNPGILDINYTSQEYIQHIKKAEFTLKSLFKNFSFPWLDADGEYSEDFYSAS